MNLSLAAANVLAANSGESEQISFATAFKVAVDKLGKSRISEEFCNPYFESEEIKNVFDVYLVDSNIDCNQRIIDPPKKLMDQYVTMNGDSPIGNKSGRLGTGHLVKIIGNKNGRLLAIALNTACDVGVVRTLTSLLFEAACFGDRNDSADPDLVYGFVNSGGITALCKLTSTLDQWLPRITSTSKSLSRKDIRSKKKNKKRRNETWPRDDLVRLECMAVDQIFTILANVSHQFYGANKCIKSCIFTKSAIELALCVIESTKTKTGDDINMDNNSWMLPPVRENAALFLLNMTAIKKKKENILIHLFSIDEIVDRLVTGCFVSNSYSNDAVGGAWHQFQPTVIQNVFALFTNILKTATDGNVFANIVMPYSETVSQYFLTATSGNT